MFLGKKDAKRWAMLALAVVLLVVTARANAQSAMAKTIAPVRVQFVNPPRYFGWNRVLTYHFKLVSRLKRAEVADLSFLPYTRHVPGSPGTSGMYGVLSYPDRHYIVRPGKPTAFHIPIRTYDRPINHVDWCLQVELRVQGKVLQRTHTCASFKSS